MGVVAKFQEGSLTAGRALSFNGERPRQYLDGVEGAAGVLEAHVPGKLTNEVVLLQLPDLARVVRELKFLEPDLSLLDCEDERLLGLRHLPGPWQALGRRGR